MGTKLTALWLLACVGPPDVPTPVQADSPILVAVSPDLAAANLSKTPVVRLRTGNNQFGPALRLEKGTGGGNLLEVTVDGYPAPSVQTYINGAGALYTRAWFILSGWNQPTGEIIHASDRSSMMQVWTDTSHGVLFRQGLHFGYPGQPTPETSAMIGLKTKGTNTANSGRWIGAIDYTMTMKWGDLPNEGNPALLNDATFGYKPDKSRFEFTGRGVHPPELTDVTAAAETFYLRPDTRELCWKNASGKVTVVAK